MCKLIYIVLSDYSQVGLLAPIGDEDCVRPSKILTPVMAASYYREVEKVGRNEERVI